VLITDIRAHQLPSLRCRITVSHSGPAWSDGKQMRSTRQSPADRKAEAGARVIEPGAGGQTSRTLTSSPSCRKGIPTGSMP